VGSDESEAPEGTRRRGTPVWARGRLGRFLGGTEDYIRTAWWGLVSPRVTESRALAIAQAVILRAEPSDQVLLSIRCDLFGWELPGGTIESGETPERALVREVREETGLDVEIIRHVGDWIRTGFRPHTAHIFLCRVVGGELTPSHETPALAWFDVDRVPDELFPWYREPLVSALAEAGAPRRVEDWHGVATIWEAMKIDLVMRWRGLPRSDSD
jgi:8-oxo-dGTP diphosphatase